MSVNSYLTEEASKLVLSGDELKGIKTSIDTLQTRLNDWFGKTVTSHFQFGSSTRGTALPRKADEYSDIDYMVVFDTSDGEKKPQTYLDRLKTFAEKKYSTSEVKQSSPVMVLELNHIRFELVPAVYSYGYKIPSPASSFTDWIYTDPTSHTTKVDDKNKDTGYFAKPLIRLVKRWNGDNGRPYYSFGLEESVVNTFFWSCTSLKDYFYHFWSQVSYAWDAPQWAKDKMDLAKKRAATAKQYETDGLPASAEAEVKKIVPPL